MKRTLTIVAAVALAMAAMAKPVDRQTASRAALSFWKHTLGYPYSSQPKDCSDEWEYGHLYLFSFAGGGFVVMAADDVARPVLAYSATSGLDPTRLPAALRPILEQYDAEIAAAAQEANSHPGRQPNSQLSTLSSQLPTVQEANSDPGWQQLLEGGPLAADAKDDDTVAIGPLLETQWDQLPPYNQLCPEGCPTGCVATAAAQVMRYWSYPPFGQGCHSYTSDGGYGVLSADFAHTLYDWANMPARVTTSSPVAQQQAVATLMYHVGVAVQMGYNPIQSGAVAGNEDGDTTAYCSQNALWRFFRYNRADLRYLGKGTMTNDQWTDLVIAELRHHRPMLYSGMSPAGGHSFICDGCDSRRYLHFNLGNGGNGDGFYAVGAINYGSYSFNMGNNCVMGIHPEYGLYLSDTLLSAGRVGGTQRVWLAACDTTAARWTVTCPAEWISLADTGFAHLGQVSVAACENTTGLERRATITFSQQGRTASLTVVQGAWDEEDYCPLTVVTECTRTGTAWAGGAHLSFESPSGQVYATVAHTTTDRTHTTTVRVAPSTLIIKYHRGGPQDRNNNYWVMNSHGDTLAAVVNAYYNSGDVTVQWPCAPLGIGSASDQQQPLAVYPNPARNSITVSANQPVELLRIVDLSGRKVVEQPAHGQRSPVVQTSGLPEGVYVVEAYTPSGILRSKLMIVGRP